MNYLSKDTKTISDALKGGEISVSCLVNEAKENIEKNKDINAFVEVFNINEEDIKHTQDIIKTGKGSDLTGIPVSVKDNICIQGKSATAASPILKGYISPYDSIAVKNMRDEGMIIIGRTNMDEFGMGSSTKNSAYGKTVNPIDKTLSPGGSSGGSAASVAMGAVPLSIGSDTGGSIRQPASFCGLVGLKPTYGLISRYGLISLSSSLDTIGILGNNVSDVFKLFEVLKRNNGEYDSTANIYKKNETPIKKKIAVPKELEDLSLSKEVMILFNKTLEEFKNKGYEVETISIPLFNEAVPIYYIIQPAEASSNLARFDGIRYGNKIEGKDLLDEYSKTRGGGFLDESIRRILVGTFVLSSGYSDAFYKKALFAQNKLRKNIVEVFKNYDVIATPTTPTSAFRLDEIKNSVDEYNQDRLTLQANLAGVPAISVPMKTDNMPIGIQFLANHNREDILFSYSKLC